MKKKLLSIFLLLIISAINFTITPKDLKAIAPKTLNLKEKNRLIKARKKILDAEKEFEAAERLEVDNIKKALNNFRAVVATKYKTKKVPNNALKNHIAEAAEKFRSIISAHRAAAIKRTKERSKKLINQQQTEQPMDASDLMLRGRHPELFIQKKI